MVREDTLDNIVTTLNTITTTNGYNNNVGLVTRAVFNWAGMQPKDYPAVMVTWVTDDKESDGASYQHVWSTLRVVLRGVVYAKTDLEQSLNEFTEDVERSMTVDSTRGGNAVYTIPVKVTAYNVLNNYYQIFDFEFDIVYQYIYGTP